MFNRLVKFARGDKYEEMDGEVKPKSPEKETTDIVSAENSASSFPDAEKLSSPAQNSSVSLPDVEQLSSPAGNSTTSLPDDTYTIDQAVDAIGFGKFQMKLSIFTGIVWMADAMEMMILSILGPSLHCQWNLPSWQEALLTTVVFSGMMVSSSLWGKCSDKYGRKITLILSAGFTFYYGFLSALSPNYIWVLILRGLVGFGIGGIPQSVTLYAEFLPTKSRAKCVVMIELFWAIGCCLVVLLSIAVMPTLGWRYLLGIASLPCIIFGAACFWLPESARYDLARGETEKALATLKRIADDNGKPMPLGTLVEPRTKDGTLAKRGQMRDLFTPELCMTTLLLWFIWFANAFSYYGIVLMTTELFEKGDSCHGGNANTEIAGPLACSLECKTLTTKDYTDLLWTTLAEFPGLFLTFLIIEYIGRKKTMAVEFFVFSFFVLLVNICTTRTVLTIFLFVARAFISGAFQAAYVYTPEVYPTTTRALGLGTCSGLARVGALITPFVAQVMLEKSVYLAISIYGVICLIATGASLLLPIETKGREMKDTHISLPKLGQTNIDEN